MKQSLSWIFLNYLRFLAKIQLAKIKLLNPTLTIIGITGSAGKTSTLLILESALKPLFKVKTNYGGNSESGIPLSILDIKISDFSLKDWLRIALLAPAKLLTNWQTYDIYLVEMGIDAPSEPKNMSYLLKIFHPHVGIFLNVSSVHQQNFKNLDEIARQKALLVNTASTAIINPQDPLVKKYSTNPNTILIKPANIKLNNFPLPPIYHISFGAALAVAEILEIDQNKAINNIKTNFHLPPGRATILKGINNCTIIDSSYNSSPLATKELLEFLNTFPSPKIAVLGDMRELGSAAAAEHKLLYQIALKNSDQIISIGPETQKYFGSKALKFSYWWQAAQYLKNNLPPKATILVKGSQNTIYLEELIKEILANPKNKKPLCRQSPYWLKVKKDFYNKNK